MAEHFWEQGFRRVAVISNDQQGTPVSQRSAGFCDSFAARGAALSDEYRRQTALSLAGGKAAMLELLRLPSPPEAVFCTNGPMTQGAYLGLQAAGGRMALAGVDDEDWTALATPPVTVVQQPVREIGTTAARLLAERIAGGVSRPRNVVLDPKLIVRESSVRG
jgi:DNA-binding LacI/PurR family transcriptional regulator